MMGTVPHITSGSELRKFQADGFYFDRVYKTNHIFALKLVNSLRFSMLRCSFIGHLVSVRLALYMTSTGH